MKFTEEQLDVLKRAIQTYGETSQEIVAMEECGELIQSISKNFRGVGKVEDVVEELADVLIMIEQLKVIYHIEDKEIYDAIEFKVNRLKRRITQYSTDDLYVG